MKFKIEKAFEMLERLFDGTYSPVAFSVDFPKYLCEVFDVVDTDNPVVSLLCENIPEICDEGEPGFDPTNMIAALKVEYEKAKALYNQK